PPPAPFVAVLPLNVLAVILCPAPPWMFRPPPLLSAVLPLITTPPITPVPPRVSVPLAISRPPPLPVVAVLPKALLPLTAVVLPIIVRLALLLQLMPPPLPWLALLFWNVEPF